MTAYFGVDWPARLNLQASGSLYSLWGDSCLSSTLSMETKSVISWNTGSSPVRAALWHAGFWWNQTECVSRGWGRRVRSKSTPWKMGQGVNKRLNQLCCVLKIDVGATHVKIVAGDGKSAVRLSQVPRWLWSSSTTVTPTAWSGTTGK